MAFQLTDDLLGIWGDPAVTGKPAGADLISRKKSLPVVAALDSDTPAGKRLAALYSDPEAESTEVAELTRLVEDAGGRAWAERTAREELARALAALRSARPAPEAAARLTALAELACHRDR